jgi:hypothetical protein
MAAAFGWDEPPTDEQAEADYAAEQCAAAVAADPYDFEAAADLVAKFPGMGLMSDAELIEIVADPPTLMGDCDEVVAVAAILLEQRLTAAAR